MEPIRITSEQLEQARHLVPRSDLSDEQYDRSEGAATRRILLLLSSQRSGSTYVCETLHRSGHCTPHEYFQPYQYLPLLADRWGCVFEGVIDPSEYVRKLCEHRTSAAGWLGVNLHGSHLRTYSTFEPCLLHLPVTAVNLVRRDSIAQAVSYQIAASSRRWTEAFDGELTTQYSYPRILARLKQIANSQNLIRSFCDLRRLELRTIYYEDFVADPAACLLGLDLQGLRAVDPPEHTTMAVQSSELNREWRERFARDFWDYEGSAPSQKRSPR